MHANKNTTANKSNNSNNSNNNNNTASVLTPRNHPSQHRKFHLFYTKHHVPRISHESHDEFFNPSKADGWVDGWVDGRNLHQKQQICDIKAELYMI